MSTSLDVICLGRLAVDLYAEQLGARLEDVTSFSKYLGGSSANACYGAARLGLRSAMLARIGDEQMGNFLREELMRAGVDTSHLIVDPHRPTALAMLALKDQTTFPLLFYRHDCADMAICAEDIDPQFIAQSKALAITGTHLSTATTAAACRKALDIAKANQLKCLLDIDYRPVLWGLTKMGDGETRFIAHDEVTAHLQRWLPDFDVIVGTEEEFHIAAGLEDTVQALKKIRQLTEAVLVCKTGAAGCVIFEGAIGNQLSSGIVVAGVKVEVLNVLGAGDAFMAGLLRGYLRGEDWFTSATYANACGALVVSRHGCAPAMPSEEELFDYLNRQDEISRPDLDVRLNHLHHTTTRFPADWPMVCGLAFDHRRQLTDIASAEGADQARISILKALLLEATEKGAQLAHLPVSPALLCDDVFGQATLNKVTGRHWWVARPVELPGSRPLRFQHGDDLGSQFRHWPHEHIVKCLVYYHPDDDTALRLEQEARLLQLYQASLAADLELLLEIIPPAHMPRDENTFARIIKRLYNLGIQPDWWKLPPLMATEWQKITAIINQADPHCRGVVLLGLNVPLNEIKAGFAEAQKHALCKGFTVGRSIFAEPARAWFANQIDDQTLIQQVAERYAELIRCWLEYRPINSSHNTSLGALV